MKDSKCRRKGERGRKGEVFYACIAHLAAIGKGMGVATPETSGPEQRRLFAPGCSSWVTRAGGKMQLGQKTFLLNTASETR